jgi:hypothetical protein
VNCLIYAIHPYNVGNYYPIYFPMAMTATKSSEIREFATVMHENDDSIDTEALTHRIESSIQKGEEQLRNGQHMGLEAFKQKVRAIPLEK